MISIGTLVVFFLVANALIYRRYVITGKNPPSKILLFLFLLSSAALGFSLSWHSKHQHWWSWGLPLFGGAALTITALFHYAVPNSLANYPAGTWSVPYMPWPPALSIFLNIFLMASLKMRSFQRFSIWTALITLFYMFYGVHQTYQAEDTNQILVNNDHDHHDQVNSSVQQIKLENIQVMSVITQV